jgi:hypothetical protein
MCDRSISSALRSYSPGMHRGSSPIKNGHDITVNSTILIRSGLLLKKLVKFIWLVFKYSSQLLNKTTSSLSAIFLLSSSAERLRLGDSLS